MSVQKFFNGLKKKKLNFTHLNQNIRPKLFVLPCQYQIHRLAWKSKETRENISLRKNLAAVIVPWNFLVNFYRNSDYFRPVGTNSIVCGLRLGSRAL